MLTGVILNILGYLVGSIPTGYILADKLAGIDIQEVGSGNIGATNLTRVLGKKFGTLTLLGDGLKALLYVFFLKRYLNINFESFELSHLLIFMSASFMVLLGNCFSVFLKFKGGKGGVTTYGVFLAIFPPASLLSISIYIFSLLFVKISAVGTLVSVLSLPLWLILIMPFTQTKKFIIVLSICFVIIVWLRHIPNIRKMLYNDKLKGGGDL